MANEFEGFSVSHAAILDGTTALTGAVGEGFKDIYGVREGSITTDEGSFDNTGDDGILSSWFWFNFVNITIKGGYISFDAMSTITGSAVTSGAGGLQIPLYEVDSVNQPSRPILVRVPSKNAAGATRTLDFIFYKCIFSPIKFEGPSYKNGLVVDYSARAVLSSTNEVGAALATNAVGRLYART